ISDQVIVRANARGAIIDMNATATNVIEFGVFNTTVCTCYIDAMAEPNLVTAAAGIMHLQVDEFIEVPPYPDSLVGCGIHEFRVLDADMIRIGSTGPAAVDGHHIIGHIHAV